MSLCGRSLLYASCSESSEPQRNDPINGDGGCDDNNGGANSSYKVNNCNGLVNSMQWHNKMKTLMVIEANSYVRNLSQI